VQFKDILNKELIKSWLSYVELHYQFKPTADTPDDKMERISPRTVKIYTGSLQTLMRAFLVGDAWDNDEKVKAYEETRH